MKKHAGKNKKAMLDMVTTAILLVTFIVVIILLSVSLAVMRLEGNSAGKVLLDISVGSMYNEQRTILYLTDEYGNKMTDLIGEALLTPEPFIRVLGNRNIEASPDAIDNREYTCSTLRSPLGMFDAYYPVTIINLREYMHCKFIPEKLSKMYGKGRYCLYAVYDEGGPNQRAIIFGNDTLGCDTEKKITAEIAPPPGYDKPIYVRLKRI